MEIGSINGGMEGRVCGGLKGESCCGGNSMSKY